MQLFTNNARSTLATGISNSSTSLSVSTGDGALFPNPTGGDFFMLTVLTSSGGVESDIEIMMCTARSGDTFTVSRPQEGTTAVLHGAGSVVSLRDTAKFFNDVGTALTGKEIAANKDASDGYAGRTLYKLNLPNDANTFTSLLSNAALAVRNWVMPDKSGTVAMTSDITGTNSGTNTGDQTITLTGDVTGTGTGSFAATIAAKAVTLAKMADVATASLLGRSTAGTGAPEVLNAATARSLLSIGNVDNTSDANKPVSSAQAVAIAAKQDSSAKDASNGFAGLTLFKLNMKNVAGTFTSWLTNMNTAVRTYTFPDKDGTVAMLSDISSVTLAGNATGAINLLKAADVASAATPDIWGGTGNFEVITGTVAITGFTAAPQAGASRRCLAGAAFPITAGANMVIKGVPSGQAFTCAAGDEIDVYAETTTKFRITITKGDGTAMAGLYGAFQNTLQYTVSGTFTAKKTGWHRITVIGTAGRGGAVYRAAAIYSATGGGAPGYAVGMRFLIAGQSYALVVSTGIAQGVATVADTPLNGVAGGSSSFSGPNVVTMTSNGGGAGLVAVSSGVVLAGGQGGTATGGDINITGGNGGTVSVLASGYGASGGGALGLQGIGYSSGDVNGLAAGASFRSASGGAGVGGNSGAITTGSLSASGGGGAGGPSADITTTSVSGVGGNNYAQVAAGNAATAGVYSLMNATAGGTTGASSGSSTAAQSGAGSGGALGSSSGAAGTFSGSGGVFNISTAATSGVGGLYGGASGGAISSASPATAGATSTGLIQIEF